MGVRLNMCGIVGYVGNGNIRDVLIDSLGLLEYRGYDSAGIALASSGALTIAKTCGRVAKLKDIVPGPVNSSAGIGHTRWATHGKPSDANAHPHKDCTGHIAVVHNGIIENYRELKETLISRGHIFLSETDTEVISHLVEEFYDGDMKKALLKTVKCLRGSFALVIVNNDFPDMLFAVKKDSPLTIGISEGQCFVASDMMAFLKYTREVLFLEDEDIAVITRGAVDVCNFSGETVERVSQHIDMALEDIGKSGYGHYMLKEIHEQPISLKDAVIYRLNEITGEIDLHEISLTKKQICDLKRVVIIGCGTSYNAGLIGKYAIERLTNLPVSVEIGSEFRYAPGQIGPDMLVVAISQSGETADTIAAAREALRKGAYVISITNTYGSSITRSSSGTIYMNSGPEIGVAATKTFTAQVLLLYLLALYIGSGRGTIAPDELRKFIASIKSLPSKVQSVLDQEDYIEKLTTLFKDSSSLFFIGRNMNYPVALEGSLKLKEIAYMFSEGFAAGELKHGPIALINTNVPVVAIATSSSTYDKTVSNIKEVMARDAIVVAVASKSDEAIGHLTDLVIRVPDTCEYLSPILSSVALQLFSYYMALHRGCPIDKPRNLAKSVTVE